MISKIHEKVASIIYDITNEKYTLDESNQSEVFYYIVSHSVRAISLVNVIEDEFDIEFDDEEIDLSFFSLERITELILSKQN